ncbi:MAG: AAA-like domain-containing protein [Fimbriimonadaceae bacterium]|nr:AAA-like domain-containing protein [Fimbriimonadaceae bacterium]
MTPRSVEMLHVVYADAVGYSRLSFGEKERFDNALASAVSSFSRISEAVAKVDNGDGFALAFRDDPSVALEAAVSIGSSLANQGLNPVRFGIHSGPAFLRPDLSGSPSLTGQAIEQAQRVMTLCPPGEILLSSAFASMVEAYPEWKVRLSLGIVGRIKDGSIITVFRVRPSDQPRIILLGHPDKDQEEFERFLSDHSNKIEVLRLEPDLTFATLGEWQKKQSEIDAAFIVGESQELDLAVAWLAQSGIPCFSALNLPREIPAEPLQLDGEKLGESLHRLVKNFCRPIIHRPISVGPVPADSPFYIRRSCDGDLENSLDKKESVILLRAPRRSGKSSLILRGLDYARTKGMRTILIDLEGADRSVLTSPEQFYRWIIAQLCRDEFSGADTPIWDPDIGPNSNLELAVRQILGGTHLLLVFDRVDRLWDFTHRDDFFGLLRSWHNRRAVAGDSKWAGLSVLLSYVSEAEALMSEVNQSPFNVGRRIDVPPLSRGEVAKLCHLTDFPRSDRVSELTSGQPALVQTLLAAGLGSEPASEIVQALRDSPYFSSIGFKLQGDEGLADACREILNQGFPNKPLLTNRLLSLGVFVVHEGSSLIPSSPLMASFLRTTLGRPSGRSR